MTGVRLRPTFQIATAMDAVEVLGTLRRLVEQSENLEGQFTSAHALISYPIGERHFWSPWLHLEIRTQVTDAVLFCRFSPHPTIWTGFMFSYLALAVLLFFSIVFGASQSLAGEGPWAFWLVPVWIVGALVLWSISQIGQRLAGEQMTQMRNFVEGGISACRQPSTDVSPSTSSE